MAHSDGVTISAYEFFKAFPDERAAIDHVEAYAGPKEPYALTAEASGLPARGFTNTTSARTAARSSPSGSGQYSDALTYLLISGYTPCTSSRRPGRE